MRSDWTLDNTRNPAHQAKNACQWAYCDYEVSGLILGLPPANERRRYKVAPSYWLGANLEPTLSVI